jgi:hypothetical protein
MMHAKPPSTPDSKNSSDVPSDMPTMDPMKSPFSAVPSHSPSIDGATDGPSLIPTDISSNLAVTEAPTSSPAPDGSFPRNPSVGGTMPPQTDHHNPSPMPTSVPNRDVSEVKVADEARKFSAQTDDTTFVTVLSGFIVVCSLLIAAVGLLVIARKAAERRNRAFGHSVTASREGDAAGDGDDENDDDDDDDEGSASDRHAETVSSLSSAWKEDLHEEFGYLQGLAHPTSVCPRGAHHQDMYSFTVDITASGIPQSNVDRIDEHQYDPQDSMEGGVFSHQTHLSTQPGAGRAENGSDVQGDIVDLDHPTFPASFPTVNHRSGVMDPVARGPDHRSASCSSAATWLAHARQSPSTTNDDGSYAEHTGTLIPIDHSLMEKYEMQVGQWSQYGEF